MVVKVKVMPNLCGDAINQNGIVLLPFTFYVARAAERLEHWVGKICFTLYVYVSESERHVECSKDISGRRPLWAEGPLAEGHF